jgi:hypothetical protein
MPRGISPERKRAVVDHLLTQPPREGAWNRKVSDSTLLTSYELLRSIDQVSAALGVHRSSIAQRLRRLRPGYSHA